MTIRNTTTTASGSGVGLENSGTVIFKEGNVIVNGVTNTGALQGQQGQGILYASCTGTASASSTLGLFQLGTLAGPPCTSTTVVNGQVMSKSGTAYALAVQAGTGGVNSSSGVFTVVKNHQGTSTNEFTCTIGTGLSCNDGAVGHDFSYVAGDVITINFTTQAAETLANITAQVLTQ